jgi:coenzyme F420-reducing hydrogenase gamma subunit
MPSASRNNFKEEDLTDRIKWYYENFDYDTVKKLEEVIEVDVKVLGCPMEVPKFFEAVDAMLKEFKIVN